MQTTVPPMSVSEFNELLESLRTRTERELDATRARLEAKETEQQPPG